MLATRCFAVRVTVIGLFCDVLIAGCRLVLPAQSWRVLGLFGNRPWVVSLQLPFGETAGCDDPYAEGKGDPARPAEV